MTWLSTGPPITVGAASTACNDDMSSFLIPAGRPGYKPGPRIGGYCLWKFESAKKAQLPSSTTNDDTLSLKKLSSPAFRLGSRLNTCLCAPWKLACSNSMTCAILASYPLLPLFEMRLLRRSPLLADVVLL